MALTRTFDELNRLTEQTGAGAEASTLEKRFGYDLAGRRLRVSGPVEGLLFTDTVRGTLKTAGGNSQSFDAFDRLIQEGTTDYRYDALDRIATRTDGSGRTNFVYATQDNDVTAITDGTGTVASGYQRTPDGELLGVRRNGPPYHALSDRHNDLTALYDQSITTLSGSTAYDPYGEKIAQAGVGSSIGYQGEYTDPATGRVNMHARWYTPTTGNFASRDDWTLEPDPSVQSNRYTYANADPLGNTDPTGHNPIALAAAAAVTAYFASAAADSWFRSHPIQAPTWSWRWPWSRTTTDDSPLTTPTTPGTAQSATGANREPRHCPPDFEEAADAVSPPAHQHAPA